MQTSRKLWRIEFVHVLRKAQVLDADRKFGDTIQNHGTTERRASGERTSRNLELVEDEKQSSAEGFAFSTSVTHPTSPVIHPPPAPKWKYDEAPRSWLRRFRSTIGLCLPSFFQDVVKENCSAASSRDCLIMSLQSGHGFRHLITLPVVRPLCFNVINFLSNRI